jgi:hypothetical protein
MLKHLIEGTQLMVIYQPYFYIIQDIRCDMYYAGAKWARGCHPGQLLKEDGYLTSSETIKELIEQYGLNIFIIRKIRTFETGYEAYDYETRFLVKVDAKNNPKFYNKHNNDHLFSYHDKKYKEKMLELYRVENPLHSPEIKNKVKSTNIQKYGAQNVFSRDSNIRYSIFDTFIEKYGVVNISQLKETQEKIRETSLKTRNVDHHLKDPKVIQKRIDTISQRTDEDTKNIYEKIKKTKKQKYGDENYTNDEQRKQTNYERYGVEFVSQNLEIKQKMSVGISKTKNSTEWKSMNGAIARQKLSDTLNSEEWKKSKGKEKSKKISKIMKDRYNGENNPNYGNFWNDEQKKIMSDKHSGEKHPQFGWIWITNGNISKKINPNIESIPENWRKGRASVRKMISAE